MGLESRILWSVKGVTKLMENDLDYFSYILKSYSLYHGKTRKAQIQSSKLPLDLRTKWVYNKVFKTRN